MADTTITILGTTGAGKTCYLVGMYYEMSAGMEGYTLTTDDDTDVKLQKLYDRLCDETLGMDRFPAGTDNMSEYEFNLEYSYEPIMSFKWTDYAGNTLKLKNEINDYKKVEKSILNSSSLFICIDGALLCGKNKQKKIRDVKLKCSRDINPFFSKYKKENKGALPPTVILLTKYDLCKNDTNTDEICEIIKEAFSPFFEKDDVQKVVAIIPVSIGANINSNDYSGELEPINIHLPIFWGIYFALNKKIRDYENRLRLKSQSVNEYKNLIDKKKAARDDEKDSFFLWRDNKKIDQLENDIASLGRSINSENDAKVRMNAILTINNEYRKRLVKELKKINLIFVNGEKRGRFFD